MIDAVASSAQVQRALICASLSGENTYIECNERPDDIYETINSLIKQGAKIRYDGSGFEIVPIELPEAGRGFTAAAASNGFAGQNNRGEYWLSGSTAYRSINGLLMTLPVLNSDSRITVEGTEEYKWIIEMTIDTLGTFNIRVETEKRSDGGTEYKIAGGQRFISPGTVKIDGDWTNASFWLCAAAMYGSGVICSNLSRVARQSDKEVAGILERFGAIVAFKGDSIAVRPSRLRSIRIDAAVTPDIIPVLSVIAAATEGQTVIYNAERVHLSKNGMLQKINKTLNNLGADITENSDGLIIKGKQKLRGGTVSSLGDHHIVMMTAIASGICEDTVAINDAEAVSRSYPDFFDDFEKLGGKIMKIN